MNDDKKGPKGSSGLPVPSGAAGAELVEVRRGESGSLHVDGRNFHVHAPVEPKRPEVPPTPVVPELTFQAPPASPDVASQPPTLEATRSLIAAGVDAGVVEKVGAADDGRSLYMAPATGAILQPTAPKKAPVPTLRERGPRSPAMVEPAHSTAPPSSVDSDEALRVPTESRAGVVLAAIVAVALLVVAIVSLFR